MIWLCILSTDAVTTEIGTNSTQQKPKENGSINPQVYEINDVVWRLLLARTGRMVFAANKALCQSKRITQRLDVEQFLLDGGCCTGKQRIHCESFILCSEQKNPRLANATNADEAQLVVQLICNQ